MPAPVISTLTSALVCYVGQAFTYQPAATNAPISWAAVGLPSGLAINTGTGRITGVPEDRGVYNVTLSATNADGTEQLIVPFGVDSYGFAMDESIELQVSLLTGAVTSPGQTAGAPVVWAKAGDKVLFSAVYDKESVIQDFSMVDLKLGLKERESETLKVINADGDFRRMGSGENARFQFIVEFSKTALKPILSSYETRRDRETWFDAIAEIQWQWQTASLLDPEEVEILTRTSQSFTIRLHRDLIDTP